MANRLHRRRHCSAGSRVRRWAFSQAIGIETFQPTVLLDSIHSLLTAYDHAMQLFLIFFCRRACICSIHPEEFVVCVSFKAFVIEGAKKCHAGPLAKEPVVAISKNILSKTSFACLVCLCQAMLY